MRSTKAPDLLSPATSRPFLANTLMGQSIRRCLSANSTANIGFGGDLPYITEIVKHPPRSKGTYVTAGRGTDLLRLGDGMSLDASAFGAPAGERPTAEGSVEEM